MAGNGGGELLEQVGAITGLLELVDSGDDDIVVDALGVDPDGGRAGSSSVGWWWRGRRRVGCVRGRRARRGFGRRGGGRQGRGRGGVAVGALQFLGGRRALWRRCRRRRRD